MDNASVECEPELFPEKISGYNTGKSAVNTGFTGATTWAWKGRANIFIAEQRYGELINNAPKICCYDYITTHPGVWLPASCCIPTGVCT